MQLSIRLFIRKFCILWEWKRGKCVLGYYREVQARKRECRA